METRERYNLEFKREISKTFLKTVSAFANYSNGEIIFGIEDNGNIIGLDEDLEEALLKIENMINDSIIPVPYFEVHLEEINKKKIIVLNVERGKDTPYHCKGKTYKRSDTSTVEVDRFELRRLAMEGSNMHYEERKSSAQELSFKLLGAKLEMEVGIEQINLDILKTLNLYNKDGYYNIAGELLADQNEIKFSGIDVVKFGDDINKILYRKTISEVSLLTQFENVVDIFEQYYVFEEVNGYKRIKKELIPKEAFRESLANAIVHRVWDTNTYIQVAMYDDRIEINSPGGLPEGISEDEYLYGNISVLRNPIIAEVFNRLNIIEKFGTGIARINQEYNQSFSKPDFVISENRIQMILPITDINRLDLSEDESRIFQLLREEVELSRKDIDLKTKYNKSKSLRILNSLVEKNLISKSGSGPGIRYRLK